MFFFFLSYFFFFFKTPQNLDMLLILNLYILQKDVRPVNSFYLFRSISKGQKGILLRFRMPLPLLPPVLVRDPFAEGKMG